VGGIEADLRHADGAEAIEGGEEEGLGDAAAAVEGGDPGVVDEAELGDGVDGDLTLDGGDDEADDRGGEFRYEEGAARVCGALGKPVGVAVLDIREEGVAGWIEASVLLAEGVDEGEDGGYILGACGADEGGRRGSAQWATSWATGRPFLAL